MIFRIEATLSEPPSSISAFRDATLYSAIFAKLDVVLLCNPGTRSMYWDWLKRNGARDFVKGLILPNEELKAPLMGARNANIRIERLNEITLPFAIQSIRTLKQG